MTGPVRHLKPSVLLIGCGRMGSALLRGWIGARIVARAHVLEPSGLPDEFQDEQNITGYDSIDDLRRAKPAVDIAVVAIKPQIMPDICPTLAGVIPQNAAILSIAAGQTLGNLESYFGAGRPVIRSMPNTPAAIGRGITVAVGNTGMTAEQKQIADTLLRAVGSVEWIGDEGLMDAVTALSGSGPAYVFFLIEAMAAAGTKCGLDAAFAKRLARQTVVGSAALAESEPGLSAATLRQNVTSPGGTTEAALNVLMGEGRMQGVFDDALAAATARSAALSRKG